MKARSFAAQHVQLPPSFVAQGEGTSYTTQRSWHATPLEFLACLQPHLNTPVLPTCTSTSSIGSVNEQDLEGHLGAGLGGQEH